MWRLQRFLSSFFFFLFFLGTKQEARKWELGDLTEKCGKSVPRRRRQRQRKRLVIESTIWAERAIFCRVWERKVVIATITSRLHLSTPLLVWLGFVELLLVGRRTRRCCLVNADHHRLFPSGDTWSPPAFSPPLSLSLLRSFSLSLFCFL